MAVIDLEEEKKKKALGIPKRDIPVEGVPVQLNPEEQAQLEGDTPEEEIQQKSTEAVKNLIPTVVSRDLQQKAATERSTKREMEKESDGSLSSSFKEALTFFAPSLIGGGIGAIFEGGEGALAGAKQGQAMGDSFRAFKERQQARQDKLGTPAKGELKAFVDYETGKPLKVGANGVVKDFSGKIVDPSRAIQAETFRQGRSLTQRDIEEENKQGRSTRSYNLNSRKFAQSVVKDAQVSGKQQETVSGLAGVMRDIDEISRLKEGTSIGPFSGRLQSVGAVFGIGTDNFVQLKSRTSSVLANYVKSISGAQSSDKEAVRLSSIVPSVNDSELVFKNKLEQLKKINGANIAGFTEALRSGQPLKKETVKALLKVLDGEKSVSKPSSRKSYEDAVKGAKTLDELNNIKSQYGVK